MSVAISPDVRPGNNGNIAPVAGRFVKGRSGHPGGRVPLGTASLRRRMRDAFKEGVDRNLCDQAISIARGEAVEDLVRSMCEAAALGGENAEKVIGALGKALAQTLSTQLAAIEFCKRVGFGHDPKPIDDSALAELVAAMLNEARARAAERAAQVIGTEPTSAPRSTAAPPSKGSISAGEASNQEGEQEKP